MIVPLLVYGLVWISVDLYGFEFLHVCGLGLGTNRNDYKNCSDNQEEV